MRLCQWSRSLNWSQITASHEWVWAKLSDLYLWTLLAVTDSSGQVRQQLLTGVWTTEEETDVSYVSKKMLH